MSYVLKVSKTAVKTIKSLDQPTIRRIHARLKELIQDPFDHRISSQVEMEKGERKSRVGDYRIFYEVAETKTVYVIAVRPRGKAYKR